MEHTSCRGIQSQGCDMNQLKQSLTQNTSLLKGKVSKHALYGLTISFIAIILATVLVTYTQLGTISLQGMIDAQRENIAIWFLDATPFLFAYWGQYVSSMIAYEASILVVDQTNELRLQTRKLENQAMHDMTHDSLTSLPNRTLFLDRLTQALVNLHHENSMLAVFTINFKQFKEINNSLGHYSADKLLKQIAVRLENVIQKPNTISHVNNNEFAAIIATAKNQDDVIATIKKTT